MDNCLDDGVPNAGYSGNISALVFTDVPASKKLFLARSTLHRLQKIALYTDASGSPYWITEHTSADQYQLRNRNSLGLVGDTIWILSFYQNYTKSMKNNPKKLHTASNNLLCSLLLFSFTCVLFGSGRLYLAGSFNGVFLVWNLFLAWIPFITAYYLSRCSTVLSYAKLIPLFLLWLLFLPNAPYIVTDLIHLRPRDGVPLWLDAVLLFMFAFHGLLLGLASTLLIHEVLEKKLTRVASWAVLILSFILCGYGIYLGRFLRWNSWDLFLKPIALLQEAFSQLTHPTALVVTAIFSFIMILGYLFLVQLIHLKNYRHDTKDTE
jgi:uncharacterized membrane protein